MKKFLFTLLSMFVLYNCVVRADETYYAEIDGISYQLTYSKTYRPAVVLSLGNGRHYSGDITIPATVKYNGYVYEVREIGNMAFNNCPELTSVTMPNSIEKLGLEVFEYSKSLKKVVVSSLIRDLPRFTFYGCASLTDIELPKTLKYIRFGAFENCSSLTKFTLPRDVSIIEGRVFAGCYKLKEIDRGENRSFVFENGMLYDWNHYSLYMRLPAYSGEDVVVPEGVRVIGPYAFSNQMMVNISLPQSLKRIEDNAFEGVEKLTELNLPNHLEHIGENAFGAKYTFVKQIVIPASVNTISISEHLFGFQPLERVVFLNYPSQMSKNQYNPYGFLLRGLDPQKTTVYAHGSEVELIKQGYSNVVNIDDMLATINGSVKPYIKGFEFDLTYGTDDQLQSVTIGDQTIPRTADGHYLFKGLSLNTEYDIVANYSNFSALLTTAKTLKPEITFDHYEATQSTVTIYGITASEDITAKPDEVGIDESTNGKIQADKNGNCTLKNLTANNQYVACDPYARYGDDIVYDYRFSAKTLSVDPDVTLVALGPTTVSLQGVYTKGDANITRTWFSNYGVETNLELRGLDPATTYEVTFNVETEDGKSYKRTHSKTFTFTTPNLILETLQPNSVSPTKAIVAAKTNMSDVETSAGFQWRKYDAPIELKSSESFAGIYESMMEGYIKNLQSDKYYKVRAFYVSVSGKLYTGEWITFDPSDFSYFQPTVHTYAATDLTDTSARVRGYALPGTDDIIEQGIQYWRTGTSASRASANMAKAIAKAPSTGINTLYTNGQVMSIVLDNLTPATQYTYRAFVTTASGTIYGEEMTFTTNVPSAIADTPVADTPVTVTGYYDMRGTLHTTPQRGINIIRYSDGSTRKMMVK